MVSKKVIVSVIGVVGIFTSLTATLAYKANDWVNKNHPIKLLDAKRNSDTETNKLQPFEQINHYPTLTQKSGPIISWKSTIKSLDWFGATRWEIDLLAASNKCLFPESKNTNLVMYSKRAFLAWDLDIKRNYLWLLMNPSADTVKIKNGNQNNAKDILGSTVVQIDSLTGDVIKVFEWKDPNNNEFRFANIYQLYYQISALPDGNVLIHGKPPSDKRSSVVLDTKTGIFHLSEIDDADIKNKVLPNKRPGSTRYNFLIPLGNNINILVASDFMGNRRGNNGTAPTGDVYLALVKDDFSLINTQDDRWKNLYKIKNVFPWWTRNKNIADNFINHSIYRSFKDKVYFTIYNKFFVVDTKLNDKQGIDFAEYDLANSGTSSTTNEVTIPSNLNGKINAISSYTVDANENVYYKLINDSVIYNLKIGINDKDVKQTTFASTTYYDLANYGEKDVQDNAKTFSLFNVEGSTGSILALNGKQTISRSDELPTEEEVEKNKYGLAVAIVANSTGNQGDNLGLLNTDKKFTKPADFSISETILNSKIPSEITVSDLSISDGFLTRNSTIENNRLKFLPFEIKEINDETGKFKIIAHLDQIPWFSNTLPIDSVPRKVEKEFKTKLTTKDKSSWISQSQITYNFKNTLPSKVTVKELDEYDLFKPSFATQTVLNNQAKPIYPKKTYSIDKASDETGKITIKAKYEYVPLGVNYSSSQDVLTYETTMVYDIFKNTDVAKLQFAGSNKQAQKTNDPLNISTTSVLKNFLQSSYLPSSIKALVESREIDFSSFLDLNNSSGFPTNKMQYELVADDINGKLIFKIKLEENYYKNKRDLVTEFEQTFINLNKKANYSFSFKNDVNNTNINNQPLSNYLASSITTANIFDSLTTITGFNPNDFDVELIPDDINGNLTVNVSLKSYYPNSIGLSGHGFNNFKTSKTFSGFLTRSEFDDLFNIKFKTDNDETLAKLKELTPKSIDEKIKAKNLNIEDKKYTSLEQLVKEVLVETTGNLIPKNWSKDNGIKVETSYDNNAGTMLFLVRIEPNDNNQIKTPLNFAISYSNFARGNKVETNDSLSFVSNSIFQNITYKGNKLNKQNIGQYIKEHGIEKLLSSNNGQYVTLIQQGNYQVKLNLSSLFNGVDLQIQFDELNEKNSLKTYSNTFVFEQ